MINEEKRLSYINTIKEFCLMDDVFLSAVFDDDIELTEFLLQVILENDKIRVKSSKAQYAIKNIAGHSAVLDIFAQDEHGRNFNVEVQRVNTVDLPKRARYYGGLIDAKEFKAGLDYGKLNDTFVIFITEHDVLGYDLPIYHIKKSIAENGVELDDGSHVIYVNAEKRNTVTPLGRLMHDFFCKTAGDMLNGKLSAKVGYMKDEGGVSKMCELMQKLADKEVKEKMVSMAKKMLKEGMSESMIIKFTELSKEEVEELAKRIA